MVVIFFLTHLLLEVTSPTIFLPSPFYYHSSSRSKRLHWWKRFKAYKLHMELHQVWGGLTSLTFFQRDHYCKCVFRWGILCVFHLLSLTSPWFIYYAFWNLISPLFLKFNIKNDVIMLCYVFWCFVFFSRFWCCYYCVVVLLENMSTPVGGDGSITGVSSSVTHRFASLGIVWNPCEKSNKGSHSKVKAHLLRISG